MDNKNVEIEKTKPNIKLEFFLILMVVLMVAGIIFLIMYPANNKENITYNKDKKDDIVKEKDNSYYIISYLNQSLVGIREDGSKEVLISDVASSMKNSYDVYNSILYYIDSNNLLHGFDLNKKKDTTYNVENIIGNLLAFSSGIIIYNDDEIYFYDLDKEEKNILPILSQTSIYADSNTNLYYTNFNGELCSFDISSNTENIIDSDSYIVYFDSNYFIYSKVSNGGEKQAFYTYDLKNYEKKEYEGYDFSKSFIYKDEIFTVDDLNILGLKDDEVNVYANLANALEKIDSIVLLKDSILITGYKYDLSSCTDNSDNCMGDFIFKSFILDIKTKKIKKISDSYEFLYDGFYNYVYVK